MKTIGPYLSFLLVFVLCCSMSKCKTNVLPETQVHGTVTEYSSGKPIKDAKFIIYGNPSGGSWTNANPYHFYDSVRTDANGNYKYTFTPVDSHDDIWIDRVNDFFDNYHSRSSNQKLIYGKDNVVNVILQKTIGATMHLINNTSQNREKGTVILTGCCFDPNYFYGDRDISASKLDTILYFSLPTQSNITMTYQYYNPKDKIASLISFTRSFKSGSNDTTITIINP